MAVLRVEVPRRFSDVDLMGHVNNIAFLDYLQEARREFSMRIFQGRDVEWKHVIVRHEINYRRPLHLVQEPAVVEIWVSKVGGASYTFEYRVLDEQGQVCADAVSVMAYFDPESEQAIRLPADLRATLTESMEGAAAERSA